MTDGQALTNSVSAQESKSTEAQGPVALLYLDLLPELRRFVIGVLRERELVEDVLQATYVKAIEQGHQARSETFKGWLFQVAFRECLACRRRLAIRARGQVRLVELWEPREIAPEDGLLKKETIESVRQALGQISEEQKQVILARIYEEKTFAQIAREMGLPLGTVLSRMRRGLDKLRHFLRP